MKNKYKEYYKKALSIIEKHTEERPEFEDRDVIERIIFPHVLANFEPKRILDVGREDYQKFYNEFFKGRELWTIDRDPERKKFGAKKHITDSISNVDKHFRENYFDVIIFNGVFGWGLNKKDEIEKAFESMYKVLKKDGLLIFGWNNLKGAVPMPINKIKNLKKFKPYKFKPLKGTSFESKTGRHTYNFYTKP